MPGLQFIKILGNLKFFSHSLKLPVDFKKPSGDPAGKHYNDAFQPADRIAIPTLIPPWFMPAEIPNKYYQDQCDKIGNNFKELHDTMIDAVGFAHTMWKLQSKFQGITIMAVSANGKPGCLTGPSLENFITKFPLCAAWTGNKAKYRDAVAKGVGKCFKDWQDNLTIPGLPLFPAFAAFPGPMAPPMPNVPVPLIACPSAMMSSLLMPDTMKSEMINAFDGGLKEKDKDKQHEAVFDGIATVLSLAFLIWMASQQVMLVMGKGSIPTFAPPYVPVGPVVGGDNLPIPGHLMA